MKALYQPDVRFLADWCVAILERRHAWLDMDMSHRVIEYYKREIEFAKRTA